MSNQNHLDSLREDGTFSIVTIKSVGIERVRSGESHRTRSVSTYVTQTCIDPKRLAFVNAIRQEDLRASRHYGIRIPELGHALVCPDKESGEQYAKDLENRKNRFDQAVTLLVQEWDQAVEDHCRAFPDDANAIRQFAPTAREVSERTTFKWWMFPLSAMQATTGSGDFDQALTGSIAERAFVEFKAQLVDAFDGYGKGNWRPDRFSQAIRTHLLSIARKSRALSVFHPSLQQLPEIIDEVLKTVPTQGIISGAPALALRGLMDILAKPSQALKYGFMTQKVAPEPEAPSTSRRKIVVEEPVIVVPQKTPSVASALSDW